MSATLVRRRLWVPYTSRLSPTASTHSPTRRAYRRVLRCLPSCARLGKAWSSSAPPRRSSRASMLSRVCVLPHLRMLPGRSPLPHDLAPEVPPLPQSAVPVGASAAPVAAWGALLALLPAP